MDHIEYYHTNDRGGDSILGPIESSVVPEVGRTVNIVDENRKIVADPVSGNPRTVTNYAPVVWKVVDVEYWLTERGTEVSVFIE